MRWATDDFDTVAGGAVIPDYPAEIEISGYFADPFISAEIDEMVNDAELMGIDLDDPELMGAFLKNMFSKIKARIQARKKPKTAQVQTIQPQTVVPKAIVPGVNIPQSQSKIPFQLPPISITTKQGTAKMGPEGFSLVSAPGALPVSVVSQPGSQGGNKIIEYMRQNPLVLAGAGGGLILLVVALNKRKV